MSGHSQYREAKITEALERAINIVTRYGQIVDGVVVDTSKSETQFVCDVQVQTPSVGSPTYFDVPLRVLVGAQSSIVEIPKLNSNCLLCFRDANAGRPQILIVDQVLKFLANCDTFIFNGGLLGGMVKAKELQAQSNKDKAIIDALIQVLTGAPINEPGNGSPSALQVALKAALSGKQSGTWDQLENSKILQ